MMSDETTNDDKDLLAVGDFIIQPRQDPRDQYMMILRGLPYEEKSVDEHIQKAIDEFHRKSAEGIWGQDFTIVADPNAPPSTLTHEKVKRMMDKHTPKRITIGREQFDVYGYHVHESDGWAVLARMYDEDEPLDLNTPLSGGIIIIYHQEGKVLGREEDLKHLARHSELVEGGEGGR
jgi:hypothetical protein